ncbi:MAG: hypothetical protein ACOCWQ_04705, partial [Nanoarchaeota archaeon]
MGDSVNQGAPALADRELPGLGPLRDILKQYSIPEWYSVIEETATKTQKNVAGILSEHGEPYHIQGLPTRIKLAESTLFKMLRMGTPDVNQVGDIVGFRAIMPDLASCYALLRSMQDAGWSPYKQFVDTLHDDPVIQRNTRPGMFRSLTTCLYQDGDCFQLQMQPEEFVNKTVLDHASYKQREFRRFAKSLQEIPAQRQVRSMLEQIAWNFQKGYDLVS